MTTPDGPARLMRHPAMPMSESERLGAQLAAERILEGYELPRGSHEERARMAAAFSMLPPIASLLEGLPRARKARKR